MPSSHAAGVPGIANTLPELATALRAGHTTSRALTDQALARIADAQGQGATVFVQVDADAARAMADSADALRRAGVELSPLMGIPISVKDLFDVAGQVTRAGSTILASRPPAARDAPVIRRLRQAGAVIVGRTNMSEFAFSGLGLNPHYGTPLSPWDRATRRVAGGSSSGAAASVADGMAALGLGTDTGGSVRIPAALCGLTGFKPTASRIPREGAVPLSTSLDSIGPIARSVACCAWADAVLAGQPVDETGPAAPPLAGLRIGVLNHMTTDGIDGTVAAIYQRALDTLSRAGARLTELRFAPLDELGAINRFGLSPIEAHAWHRTLLPDHAEAYDPRVLARIQRGAPANAADYIALLDARAAMIAQARPVWDAFDAVACPTVPIVPPPAAPLANDDALFTQTNALVLRNPSIINFLDGCALSLPCHAADEAPVGLMLSASGGRDADLLCVGRAVEGALAEVRR